MFYTYILYSKFIDRFYIGFSSDLNKRLHGHKSGKTKFTRQAKDWALVYYEKYNNKHDALLRESFLKKKDGMEYLDFG